VQRLERAWKYNELTYPNVDSWIKKQKDLSELTREELLAYCMKKNLPLKKIRVERKNRSCIVATPKKISVITGSQATACSEQLGQTTEESARRLKGRCASPGSYRGIVRVVLQYNANLRFKKGLVLVTPMTRPQFNDILRNAGAIITDEGGALCHAAILSRENGIPCIVGTKHATTMLKTGDTVLIDAGKGTIQVLKS